MRGSTIAAIAAAAAAGVLALVFLSFVPMSRGAAQDVSAPAQNDSQPATGTDGYRKINVTVNGIPIVADIAADDQTRRTGLAVRDTMAENESMLFVFPKASDYSFWMKDMKFPIDIIWLDSDRRVIHVEHSLPPCTPDSCPTFDPQGDALYVLETVAGFADKYNVSRNTLVEFDPGMLQN